MGAGVHDHGYVLGYERVSDHAPNTDAPRHRLWRMRAGQIVTATGAIERPLSFAGNDLPGVMLASAMRDYVVNYAVAPGKSVVVVTNNDDAYRTAIALRRAGIGVPAVVDARPEANGPLVAAARAAGITVLTGKGIRKVKGGKAVTGVEICRIDSKGTAFHRGIRLRRGGHVGRLVARRASVVALRRQAGLGRGASFLPPRCQPPAFGRGWRGLRARLRRGQWRHGRSAEWRA